VLFCADICFLSDRFLKNVRNICINSRSLPTSYRKLPKVAGYSPTLENIEEWFEYFAIAPYERILSRRRGVKDPYPVTRHDGSEVDNTKNKGLNRRLQNFHFLAYRYVAFRRVESIP